jgi:hypothetical protein
MKRPSFQFYPSDWLRDTALRSCSTGARGLWIDMICFMHEGNPYGYLKVGDKVILAHNLARMVGESLDVVEAWLEELKIASVFDIDNGIICSRRMIRDEELRQKRSEGGKLGGNPWLKVKPKDNLDVNQNPTPSSSSSSSSSSLIKIKNNQAMRPSDVSESVWNDFVALRAKQKKPFTETALKGFIREANKAGWSLQEVFERCCERGWQGFQSEWVEHRKASGPDPGLAKLKEDEKLARPMPANIREMLQSAVKRMP